MFWKKKRTPPPAAPKPPVTRKDSDVRSALLAGSPFVIHDDATVSYTGQPELSPTLRATIDALAYERETHPRTVHLVTAYPDWQDPAYLDVQEAGTSYRLTPDGRPLTSNAPHLPGAPGNTR